MDWVEELIADTQYWLDINARQGTLPTMTLEDELFKQEVRHKKQMLDLLLKFKQHPKSKPPITVNYPKDL